MPAKTESPRAITHYNRLPSPVILVTQRGREVFHSSRELLDRLAEIGETPLPAGVSTYILAVQSDGLSVTVPGVAALETMLRLVGLAPFYRATRELTGPERAAGTRWNWDYLSEYLGWHWHRA